MSLALVWAAAWVIVLSPVMVWRWLDARRVYFERPAPVWALFLFILAPALWGAVSGTGFAISVALLGGGSTALRWRSVIAGGFISGLAAPLFLGLVWTAQGATDEILMPWTILATVSGVLNAGLAAGCLAVIRGRSGTASKISETAT